MGCWYALRRRHRCTVVVRASQQGIPLAHRDASLVVKGANRGRSGAAGPTLVAVSFYINRNTLTYTLST